jgi:hypothetical protein
MLRFHFFGLRRDKSVGQPTIRRTLYRFSTDKAARAAETSAIAAKQTVDEIRANAERELRAYVYVRPKEMLWYVDLKKLIVKNSVTNTSKTPAYDIRHFADAGFQRYPFPNDFVVQDPPFRIGTPKLSIGPSEAFVGTYDMTIEGDVRVLTETGQRVYLSGQVTYRDAFQGEWRTTLLFLDSQPRRSDSGYPNGRHHFHRLQLRWAI